MENTQQETEELWRAMAGVMSVAIIITHAVDGMILFNNELFRLTFGVPSQNLISCSKFHFYCNPQEYELLLVNLDQEGIVRDREVGLKKNRWHTILGKNINASCGI